MMLDLFLFNSVVIIVTLLSIVFKISRSPKRIVREAFDGAYFNPWESALSSFGWQTQGLRRSVGYESEDFAFNVVMMLFGMFMVVLGVFYNAGFDLLGFYSDMSVSLQVYYPWAFLFLVGGTLVILINSFFAFLKMMD